MAEERLSGDVYVPGLVNFGNTCFANALLQALASCGSFTQYIRLVHACLELSHVTRLWNGLFDGPKLWAAGGPLARALEDCMFRLQPRPGDGQRIPASALEVLHALVKHGKTPFQQTGRQQDICEALECLVSSVQSEVLQWLKMQSNPYADRREVFVNMLSLKDLVVAPPSKFPISLNIPAGPQFLNYRDGLRVMMEAQLLRGPMDGLLADDLVCTRCGHAFTTQFHPFVALMLPIPEVERQGRDFVVPDDLSLLDCLDAYFDEREQGPIVCPKCSLVSTVGAMLRVGVGGSGAHLEDACGKGAGHCEERGSSKGLAEVLDFDSDCMSSNGSVGGVVFRRSASFDLHAFQNGGLEPVGSGGRLRSEVLREVRGTLQEGASSPATFEKFRGPLQEVDIAWREAKSMVLGRTVVGRLPKVLVIFVQRRVFTGFGFAKIHGLISFPKELDMEDYMHLPSVHNTKYALRSAVVHHGDERSGHYFTARCVKDGGDGEDRWIVASDERIQPIAEEKVLSLECTLLMYEREEDADVESDTEDADPALCKEL